MHLPKTLANLRKFGRLPLTGRDFIELCDLNNIELVMSSETGGGFYYYADGKHTIVLSTGLSPKKRAFVGWHEFAHFLQNFSNPQTTAAFSNVEKDSASEKLADVFASIALRPDNFGITGPMDFVKMLMRTKR